MSRPIPRAAAPGRRHLLAGAAGLFAWAHLPRASSAAGARPEERRLLVLVLRGGLDGLAAVPAVGDPAWASLRGPSALRDGHAVRLDGTFAMNAHLRHLAELYAAGEALVVHAAATPYRERSHFEAQDVLESGLAGLGGTTGWLNRALAHLPRGERLPPPGGLALTPTIPLIMRGAAPVDTWQPQAFPMVDADTLARLLFLYERSDPALAGALRRGAALDEALGMGGGGAVVRGHPQLGETVRAAAALMARPDGPRVAAMNLDGWDTHISQGFETGRMALQLPALDAAVAGLREGLGPVWRSSLVVVVTEFGRTVRLNGSGGTDHGTATVALLVGGALRGGRVLADWPGLAEGALHQGRDLRATTDLRAVLKGALAEHLGLDAALLGREVFPESAGARAVSGLLRAA